jgi:hypothetical protein
MAGRPSARWQKKLLQLKNIHAEEISMSELEEITGQSRSLLKDTLCRIINRTRVDTFYNTQELYEAINNKLKGNNK